MKSIFSSSIKKYLDLLGSNHCILRFFCYDPWLSSGAKKWEKPVMLSRPVSVKVLVDWVHSATERSHPHLCRMVPGVMKVHRVTQGRKKSTGIFTFVFLLSFLDLLQFGIKKSTCNCKLKGCLHLSNTLLGFLFRSMSLDPENSGFFVSISHIKWIESKSFWEGVNLWSQSQTAWPIFHPLIHTEGVWVVHLGNLHPTWCCKMLWTSHPHRWYCCMGWGPLSRKNRDLKIPWNSGL